MALLKAGTRVHNFTSISFGVAISESDIRENLRSKMGLLRDVLHKYMIN